MKKYQLYFNKNIYNFYMNSGEIFTYIFYIDLFFILFIIKIYNIIFYIFYIYFIFIYKIYIPGSNIFVIRYNNKNYLNFYFFYEKSGRRGKIYTPENIWNYENYIHNIPIYIPYQLHLYEIYIWIYNYIMKLWKITFLFHI